jgi:hypothetical protein
VIGVRAALVTLWLLAIAVFSDTASPKAAPYPDGAPPGFSGGFGEQSCHACHFDVETINARPGQVTLAGVPERFVAGQQYPLTITLTRPGMAAGGFQLAARVEDGGAQAGTIELPAGETERLAVQARNNVQYVNQRHKGTAPSEPGTAKWTVLWTAPQTPAAVVFHVAANAADNDESVRGDYIYTATVRANPQP